MKARSHLWKGMVHSVELAQQTNESCLNGGDNLRDVDVNDSG